MTEALVTTNVPEFRLIARDPHELEHARTQLVTFFTAKLAALDEEATCLEENLTIAQKFPIKTQPIKAALNRVARQRRYYEKAKAAAEAGFHIIPNFDASVFALRTTQKSYSESAREQWRASDVVVKAAPAGEGRYVSPRPAREFAATFEKTNGAGHKYQATSRWGEGLDEEIDFPFVFARPEVLTATQQVMAAKIFDELAVLPQRRRDADPMVVGVIKDGDKRMTFLVVWFLDTNTL